MGSLTATVDKQSKAHEDGSESGEIAMYCQLVVNNNNPKDDAMLKMEKHDARDGKQTWRFPQSIFEAKIVRPSNNVFNPSHHSY
jgi:hypothetical protein